MKSSYFRLYLLYFFLTVSHVCLGQSELDIHAQKAPASAKKDLTKLAQYLTQSATNDYDKVRAIYIWITHNIKYDIKAFQKGKIQVQSVHETLKKRKGVCEHYSRLFVALCKEVNIDAFFIPGYSKGITYDEKDPFYIADHAWNAVKINQEWHLVDATWGSGYTELRTSKIRMLLYQLFKIPYIPQKHQFIQKPNDFWFLTKPYEMVKTHLPINPIWQLRDCPVPIAIFEQNDSTIQAFTEADQRVAGKCMDVKSKIADYERITAIGKLLHDGHVSLRFNEKNHRFITAAYVEYARQLLKKSDDNRNTRIQLQELEEAAKYFKDARRYALLFDKDNLAMKRYHDGKVHLRNKTINKPLNQLLGKIAKREKGNEKALKQRRKIFRKITAAQAKVENKVNSLMGDHIAFIPFGKKDQKARVKLNLEVINHNYIIQDSLRSKALVLTDSITRYDRNIQEKIALGRQTYQKSIQLIKNNHQMNQQGGLTKIACLSPIVSNNTQLIKNLATHRILEEELRRLENRLISPKTRKRYIFHAVMLKSLNRNKNLIRSNKLFSVNDIGADESYDDENQALINTYLAIGARYKEQYIRYSRKVAWWKKELKLIKKQSKAIYQTQKLETYRYHKGLQLIEKRYNSLSSQNQSFKIMCKDGLSAIRIRIRQLKQRLKKEEKESKS